LQLTDSESILKRVRQTYSELESYSDIGTVFLHGLGDRITEFKTYFVRPKKVRFEWQTRFTEPDKVPSFLKATGVSHGTVWSDGVDSYCSVFGQKSSEQNLAFAIAAGTGEASVSLTMLNLLLLPADLESGVHEYWTAKLNASGFTVPEEAAANRVENFVPWHEMSASNVVGSEDVDGCLCHHIVGTTDTENDTEAWIDKDTYLVRRLRIKSVSPADFAQQFLAMATEMTEKAGIPLDKLTGINTVLNSDICHQYNYRQVSMNQPLPDQLFNSDLADK
jgi:hypothetical protein